MSAGLFTPPVAQESAPQFQGPMPPDQSPMTIPQCVQMLMALLGQQGGRITPQDQQSLGLLMKGIEMFERQYGSQQGPMQGDQAGGPGGPGGQQGGYQDEGTSDQFSHAGNPNMNFAGPS